MAEKSLAITLLLLRILTLAFLIVSLVVLVTGYLLFGLFSAFALYFASGVGAGFWVTSEFKEKAGSAVDLVPGLNKFLNLVYVSSGFLLLATISGTAIILVSAFASTRK